MNPKIFSWKEPEVWCLDREKRLAYACLSPRTDPIVLKDFCKKLNYQPIIFHSIDETGTGYLSYECYDVCCRPVCGDMPGFHFGSG